VRSACHSQRTNPPRAGRPPPAATSRADQPEFGGWGFNVERGPEIKRKWDLIPDNVDVLLTHGPPRGHGGRAKSGVDAGCADLLDACARVKPLVHVFGHIHEDYGVSEDAHTKYINASTCTIRYEPRNPAVIVDVQV
jgi:Icc-related predicted phosphoesterase